MIARLTAAAAFSVALALGAGASAQDRVVASLRVDAWDQADLSWASPPNGEPIRVIVRGTLTNALDGSEIDATQVATPSRVLADASPLVFPTGSRLIEARGAHAFLFEVPQGHGATISLNTMALAGRLLVTASEVRQSVSGVIFVDVLAWQDAVPPATGPATAEAPITEASVVAPIALAGGALGLPLLLLGFVAASRRRVSREDALLRRVAKARAAIVSEGRTLGPAFEGALASAEALAAAARSERGHLVELDRALARTAWVRLEGASVGQAAMRGRRVEGLARMESIVAQLEETVVRMAVCVADRSAIAGLARDLDRMKSELEVGESVEQEIAAIERR